jgi:MtrB/PioB family decaheme-associated outer membrane protein
MVGQFSRPFDMKTRRYVAEGGIEYLASPNLTLRQNVRNIDRKGDIPFGGSFGHASFVETPQPIDYRTTDLDGDLEYTRGNALLRAGYAASSFSNHVTSLVFENPYRLTDTTSATSAGRFALSPSNTVLGLNGMLSYRLPRRTRVTGYLSTSSLKDAGDPIIPMTINTALPVTPLDRPTVNGSARMNNANLTFTSRPSKYIAVDMRYKFYDYDNQTPEFVITQRVAYDAALQSLPRTSSEPFGLLRHTFDADVKYSPVTALSAGIGFSRIGEERTHRIFESTTDDVARVVVDSVGNRWFTLRTKLEHAERRGTGIGQGVVELAAIGEQTGMRHFDIADRNRNRVTLIGTATPIDNASLNVSVASGKDDYLNSVFGLLDNRHRVYTIGTDLAPREQVTLGVSYAYEDYRALSRSRQASPGAQFNDPSRNWSTDGHDRVHSILANAEVRKIAEKLDVRAGYDFSRARTLYLYGVGPIVDRTLPEETDVIASTLPPPTQLPSVLSETQRGTLDLLYAFAPKVDFGFTYWYDRYRVSDFTLDAEANPTLDRGNALLLGYVYRPYTANTFFGRFIWHW